MISAAARSDLRAASRVLAALLVLGIALGPLWAWWSPSGPAAVIYPDGALLPDESEAWIGADGRFAVLMLAVGLLAGPLSWWLLRAHRGTAVGVALAVGGVGCSLLTWLGGWLLGGGDGDGDYRVRLTDGSVQAYSKQLPLSVHARGLLFLAAGLALLIYLLLVAFAASDDLDRPDEVRQWVLGQRAVAAAPGSATPVVEATGTTPPVNWEDASPPRPS